MSLEERLSDMLLEWEEAAEQGTVKTAEELCLDYPDLIPQLARRISALERVSWLNRTCSGEAETTDRPTGHTLHPPAVLADRYRLDEVIGEGGFGQVWRSYDLQLQRVVAVKISHPTRQGIADPALGLLEEARKAANLRHPGIVTVYDVGQHENSYFIVSELVEGCDLARKIGAESVKLQESVRIVAEAARLVHHAHTQRFIHRDIKPANILLDSRSAVYLADFGTSISIEATADGTGTLAYMAPEQLFDDLSRIDSRVDIYGLGMVLYELLTGKHPFPKSDPSVLRTHILQSVPPLPSSVTKGIPREVERICLKCLAKSPANRYTTGLELAEDLSHWLNRRKTNWMLVCFGAVTCLMIGVFLAFRQRPVSANGENQEWQAEVTLFNEADLTGWEVHSGNNGLRSDEAVQVRAGGVLALGHERFFRICTTDKFKDFVLRLEYRYLPGGTISNAGGAVLLRVAAPEKLAHFHPHVKLRRSDEGKVWLPGKENTGAEGKSEANAEHHSRALGEWNTLEIRCVGSRIDSNLNGQPSGFAEGILSEEGHIGLASQGSDVEFRNLRLQVAR